MAPQMFGVDGALDGHDEYYIEEHIKSDQGKFEWTERELIEKGYVVLGEPFSPISDIACHCYLKSDGSHAMLLMVDNIDEHANQIDYLTVIDLILQETDNKIGVGDDVSTDVPEKEWLRVNGVIATDFRDEGIGSGRGIALELYSRIIKFDERLLVSDFYQYPAGRKIWQRLPEKLTANDIEFCIQALNYNELTLLKYDCSEGYQFNNGELVKLSSNNEFDDKIWGVEESFQEIVLIARNA